MLAIIIIVELKSYQKYSQNYQYQYQYQYLSINSSDKLPYFQGS